MPTLGDYYRQAGGDLSRMQGLFQYASSPAAAGLSMEQILRNYMRSPTEADQAAYNAGETAFNSAYMTGDAMNKNDANAYAIQTWKTPTLQDTVANQQAFDKFDWKQLPTGAFQQSGNAVSPVLTDAEMAKYRAEHFAPANPLATVGATRDFREANGGPNWNFSGLNNLYTPSEQGLRMNQANLRWAGTSRANTTLSNGSAYAGGYNQPEGTYVPGTTGVNPNVSNPNATSLTNNPYGMNTEQRPNNQNTQTPLNTSNTPGATEQRPNPNGTTPVINNTTNTTTQTPYLGRMSNSAFSGAPRYNDITQNTGQQTNGGLTEATKTPNLDTPLRRGNIGIDFTKALWR